MGKFHFEGLMKAAQPIIDESVMPLELPAYSVYSHLLTLTEEDVSFDGEYVRIISPKAEYQVKGYYTSRLEVEDKEREVTYASTLTVPLSDGFMISKSKNCEVIPQEYMGRVAEYLDREAMTAAQVKELVIKDAMPKLKAKVRKAKDPIELEDLHRVEILECKIRKTTVAAVEWCRVTRISDGLPVATAYGFEGESAQYQFIPDESKKDLVPPVKSTKPEKIAKPAPAPKNKRPKGNSGKLLGGCIKKMVAAILVAALLLAAEYGVILLGGALGIGSKAKPGVYAINTENYQKYILFRTDRYKQIVSQQQQTYIVPSLQETMENFPLFLIVPGAIEKSVFDTNQSKSIRYYGDYKPTSLLPITIHKYIISDLYIRYQVTYSYNGEETTVEKTQYFKNTDQLKSNYLTADFPQESIQSKTNTYVSDMKGNTYTQTSYWPGVDYWYVTILEVSGTAEVKEAA